MDDTAAATIERLTAERDAALRRVEYLTLAITSQDAARERAGTAGLRRYLLANGWKPAIDSWWRSPSYPHWSVDGLNVVTAARDLADLEERPLLLVLADLLEHADAAR